VDDGYITLFHQLVNAWNTHLITFKSSQVFSAS